MDDKRNLIAAILLSVAILLGWNFVSQKFFPTPAKPDVTTTVAGTDGATTAAPAPAADGTVPPGAINGAAPAAPVTGRAGPLRPVATVLAEGKRIPITNPKLKGSINLVGARIDDITLTNYRQTIKKDSPAVRLFAPAGAQGTYFAAVAWTAGGVAVPDARTLWTATGTSLTPTTPVTLTWTNPTGQTFRIDYSIDQDYLITAKQSLINRGAAPITASTFAYVNRLGAPTDPHEKSSWTNHIGPMGVFDGKSITDWDYDDIAAAPGATVKFDTTRWLGFTDKYWLAAVIPGAKETASAMMLKTGGDEYQTIFSRPNQSVAAGTVSSATSRIFAGAKETNLLSEYQDKLGITHLNKAIDWGWFEFFEKPIFQLLDWLFRMVGNFGVAIMLLTLIIRGLMFPIAQRQFGSMAQMRLMQPKMKALQERYKDDKPRQQQELMKLYKDEKINPLAGCLPIIIQIPIFYALYKVLILTIEMRHQPFILWIKDLSAPDPAHILNLFGLLPFTPPSLLSIGILALILGVTMWLQFRLNPQSADPVQAQVFKIMPWMFMFIMAPFAAGLLLYWITNNCLSIAQQQWMYRKFPQLKAAPAK